MECEFLEVYGDKIEGNGHKLEHGKFQLHIRIFFYHEGSQVLQQCPREVVGFPSLELFKISWTQP